MNIDNFVQVITASQLKSSNYHLDCPRCNSNFKMIDRAAQDYESQDIIGINCSTCGLYIVIDKLLIAPRVHIQGFATKNDAEKHVTRICDFYGSFIANQKHK